MTAPPGFIVVHTEAGSIVIGVSQIASIQPGGRRSQYANLRMGNGEIFAVTTNVDAVLDLIDDALDEALLPAEPKASPSQLPAVLAQAPASVAPVQQAEFKSETKRRGRPPKNKSV